MDISSLLYPITLQDFATIWNKHSHVFQGRALRFAELAFDHAELKTALRSRRLGVKAQYVDPVAGHTELMIDAGKVDECFAQGMTICVQNVDKILPDLAQQSAALRRSMHFSGAVNFSCYWSPPSGGFDLHCDDHPVFILQLKGMKKWYYGATPAVDRMFGSIIYSAQRIRDLRAVGLEIQDPEGLESIILSPGDMLYLPAGAWHKTCAVDGESLSLTLRCFEGTAFDLVQNMLDKHMSMGVWHDILPLIGPSDTDRLSIPTALETLFAERLSELKHFVAGLTVMDLAHIWAERFAHANIVGVQAGAIAEDQQLVVSKNTMVFRTNDESATDYWVHNGLTECKLSLADPTWFERVMHAGSFTAFQARHWGSQQLSWDTAKCWLEELLDVGVLSVLQSE